MCFTTRSLACALTSLYLHYCLFIYSYLLCDFNLCNIQLTWGLFSFFRGTFKMFALFEYVINSFSIVLSIKFVILYVYSSVILFYFLFFITVYLISNSGAVISEYSVPWCGISKVLSYFILSDFPRFILLVAFQIQKTDYKRAGLVKSGCTCSL